MGQILGLRVERAKAGSRLFAMPPEKIVEDRLPGGRVHARGVGEHAIQVENGTVEALAGNDDDIVAIGHAGPFSETAWTAARRLA